MIKLSSLQQADPRWGSKSLGGSALTIASDGCTLTSLTMAMQNWGINLRPDEVEAKLRAVGGFENGRIIWTKIPVAFPELLFHYRWDTTNNPNTSIFQKITPEAALLKIRRLIQLGQPVHLQVSNGIHWVLGFEVNCMMIMDPLMVGPIPYAHKYGDILKTLWGFSIVLGSPLEVDDTGDPRTAQGFAGGLARITDTVKRREFIDLFL